LLESGRRLLEKLNIDCAETSVESLADELRPKLQRARSASAQRLQLTTLLKEMREQLEKVARERQEAQSRLEGFMHLAGVQSLQALADADGRSRKKKTAISELAQIEARLRKSADGRSLEEFSDEVGRCSEQELRDRMMQVIAEQKTIAVEHDQWFNEATRAGVELERMQRRGAESAEARQQAEYTLGRALEQARRYAILRSAEELLERAVREYRERNETKVLHRARELFQRLTNGAYSTLRSDVEGGAEARLLAVRGDEEVSVSALSEGTRDQLFLALRLAALEATFEQRGAVPVLADDLLTTFDDERTASALEVLAQLGKKTQVLLLTHHQHVVELARTRLSQRDCLIHELGSGSEATATNSWALHA
jgi:chromosome segregation protein